VPRPATPIVALVCSSGGLEALRRVLGPLPADLGAAVVVLQHQRPTLPSKLAHLLGNACALPVRPARDGDPLESGIVLVVPPGTHALGTVEGTLALVPSNTVPPYRPSADLLLATLAVTAGPRVVVGILSGMGNDGATGACAVHLRGGTVLAADRASSTYFAMAEAAIARDDTVDRVLPVDALPAALVAAVAAVREASSGRRPGPVPEPH
jgi:two-component system, chemotaxis family, protein-glutamate methylesterase/glutaminase